MLAKRVCMLTAIVMLWAWAGLTCRAQEPPATGRVSVGAAAVWSTTATVRPSALVEADAPVNLGKTEPGDDSSIARVLAQLRLAGVQGQTVNPADVATFSSLQFDLYIKRRIGSDSDGGSTYVYLHGGGAALRDSEGSAPFQRTPLWYSAGITLERREGKAFPHRWVSLGFGHSDLSSPPRRQPGTLGAAARDAIPRDLIASGSTSIKAPGKVAVILSVDLARALWGPRGTMHVAVSTTLAWQG